MNKTTSITFGKKERHGLLGWIARKIGLSFGWVRFVEISGIGDGELKPLNIRNE